MDGLTRLLICKLCVLFADAGHPLVQQVVGAVDLGDLGSNEIFTRPSWQIYGFGEVDRPSRNQRAHPPLQG